MSWNPPHSKQPSSLCKLNCFFLLIMSEERSWVWTECVALINNSLLWLPCVLLNMTGRFIIVPKQDDEGVHPECRLTWAGWLRTNGLSLMATAPSIFNLSRALELGQEATLGGISGDTATLATDHFLFKMYLCSRVNLANENTALTCYGCPLSCQKWQAACSKAVTN